MKNFLYLLILLIAFPAILVAQPAAAELKKIKATDSLFANLSMNISYNVYTNFVTHVPYDKLKGIYKRSGKNFFSDIGGIITIRNEKILFSVDTSSEQIIIGDHQKRLYRLGIVDLDTLVPFFTKATIADLQNGQRMMTMVFNDEHEYEYEKIQLFYNPQTYLTNKIIFYYSNEQSLDDDEDLPEEKPRLEILFQNINTKENIPMSVFSESPYIKWTAKGPIGIGSYKGYEIMDDREIARSGKTQ